MLVSQCGLYTIALTLKVLVYMRFYEILIIFRIVCVLCKPHIHTYCKCKYGCVKLLFPLYHQNYHHICRWNNYAAVGWGVVGCGWGWGGGGGGLVYGIDYQ